MNKAVFTLDDIFEICINRVITQLKYIYNCNIGKRRYRRHAKRSIIKIETNKTSNKISKVII
jgi:hypothetical protein